MHIVYVSREYPPSLRGGGIASYLKIMAEGFAARGEKVTVIAASDNTAEESDKVINGVRIIRLSGGDFNIDGVELQTSIIAKLRFAYRFISYRKKVRNVIDTLDDIDIIEVAEYGAEGLYLKGLNVPVVYRLHTPALLDHVKFDKQSLNRYNIIYYPFGQEELRILKTQAKYITSCSTSLKEWVMKYVGVDGRNIQVIYNPLQPDFISSHKNEKIDINKVFFAGTICDWKGTEDLVKACEILNASDFSVTLNMAGKVGAFGERLKAKYKECTWLTILGKLPQSELKDYYSTSGVVCFPSWWENMPMVCIEAMSMGAIVIGSNSGGMAEIIENGISGFLLPPMRPDLWAAKIKQVIELPIETRKQISMNAIKRIKDVFGLDVILTQTMKYFNSIIEDFKHK